MTYSSPAALPLPHGRRRGSVLGIGQVMLAAGLWSTVGVATELVPAAKALPQDMLGMARMLIGGPAILLLAVLVLRGSLRPLLSLDPRRLVDFAAGAAVFQLCLFKAFELLGVTATVFFTVCLPPMIGATWEMLRGRQRQEAGSLLALGLAVAGLVVFAGWMPGAPVDRQSALGLAVAVVGSVAFVVMTGAARALAQAANPLLVAGAGLCLAGVMLGLVGLVLGGAPAGAPALGWEVAGLLLYLGLGPTALAYVVYCAGMARCRTANVGLIAAMVEPALAAWLAHLLIGERLSAEEIVGCALVMLAMLVLWRSERGRSRPVRG